MKHPSFHARRTPDKIAYVMAGSGETMTYAQLDARSNRGAQALRALGAWTLGAVRLLQVEAELLKEALDVTSGSLGDCHTCALPIARSPTEPL